MLRNWEKPYGTILDKSFKYYIVGIVVAVGSMLNLAKITFFHFSGGHIMTSIYVGNLPYEVSEQELLELFREFGEVNRVTLVTDHETDRPRGFGFVEMPNNKEAQRAIDILSGREFRGRMLTVNEKRDKSENRNASNASKSVREGQSTPDKGSTGYRGRDENSSE